MKRLLPLLLLAAPLVAQPPPASNHPPYRAQADLGTCTNTTPKTVIIIDALNENTCASDGGTAEVQCNCLDGAWVPMVTTTTTQTLTNKSIAATQIDSGTIPAARVGADHIDAITEVAAALKSGADGTVVTGTAGTAGYCAEWNADGDLVEAASAAACGAGDSTRIEDAATTTYVDTDEVANEVTIAANGLVQQAVGGATYGTIIGAVGSVNDTLFTGNVAARGILIDHTNYNGGKIQSVGTGAALRFYGLQSQNGQVFFPSLNDTDTSFGISTADAIYLEAGGERMITLVEDSTDTGTLGGNGEAVIAWSNDGTDSLVTITGDTTQAGNVLEIDADGDSNIEFSISQAGVPSSPTDLAGTGNEVYGAGATVAGTKQNNTIFGNSASADTSADWSAAFGYGAATTGDYGVALGASSSSDTGASVGYTSVSTSGVSVGRLAKTTSEGIAIGYNADCDGFADVVCIGHNISSAAAKPSAVGQVIIGGDGANPLTVMYLGEGRTDASPVDFTIQPTGGSGTDIAGGDLQLAGAQGTGTGAGGVVRFQYAAAGGSGSSANALATAAEIRAVGVLYLVPLATAPATCSIGESYVDTSGAYCACSATDTWENMTATGTCA